MCPCWLYVGLVPLYFCFTKPMRVSGTGLFTCQLAKHAFKAGKVITAVSTFKIPKVKELLGEGVVDESKVSFMLYKLPLGFKVAHLF